MANKFTDLFRRNKEPENQVVGAFTLSPDGTTLINYKPDKPIDIVAVPDGVEKIGNGVFAGERAHGAKSVLLPDSVKEIGDSAFAGNKTTENVMLPANLEVIGRGAFADSPQLNVGSIPDSIRIIDEGSFRHNQQIVNVDLSNSNIEKIGEGAFRGCKELQEVKLPAVIEEKDNQSLIGRAAFANSGLERINIPDGLTKIEPEALMETKIKELEIPDSVKKIGMNACYNSDLQNVMLPSKLESLGDYAFGQQSGRERTTVYVPEDASDYIKHKAPAGSVMVPESNTASDLVNMGLAKTNEDGALIGVDKRVSGSVIIDEKITGVESNAFEDCKKISSVSVESNFTTIHEDAFKNITNVEMPKLAIDEEMMQKAEARREQEVQQSANIVTEVKAEAAVSDIKLDMHVDKEPIANIPVEETKIEKVDTIHIEQPVETVTSSEMTFEEALAAAKAREIAHEATKIVEDVKVEAEVTTNIKESSSVVNEPIREVEPDKSSIDKMAMSWEERYSNIMAEQHAIVTKNFDSFRETFSEHVDLLDKVEANVHAKLDNQPLPYPEMANVDLQAEIMGYPSVQQQHVQQERLEDLDKVVDRYQSANKAVAEVQEVEKEQEQMVALAF